MTYETATKQFQPQQLVASSVEPTISGRAVFEDIYFISDPKVNTMSQSFIILSDLNTSTFAQGLMPSQGINFVGEEFTLEEVEKLKKSISNFYNGKQATHEQIMEILE